ncbi:MAG: hypothetical protein WBL88_16350 [Nitrososphaeraceae archaeon]
MRKEPYHCPYCHQTCSRQWNMKVHIQHPSELYSDKLEESTPLSPLPISPSKEKDASDKLLETIREAVEFKKMLSKQLQSFSSPSSSFLGLFRTTTRYTRIDYITIQCE